MKALSCFKVRIRRLKINYALLCPKWGKLCLFSSDLVALPKYAACFLLASENTCKINKILLSIPAWNFTIWNLMMYNELFLPINTAMSRRAVEYRSCWAGGALDWNSGYLGSNPDAATNFCDLGQVT